MYQADGKTFYYVLNTMRIIQSNLRSRNGLVHEIELSHFLSILSIS
jgi:hypothetical protein